jgi:hypothetical protein
MSKFTAKGSRIYIGGTGALASEPAWVKIGDVLNIPAVGHVFEEIATTPLDPGDTEYFKGARGTEALTIEFNRDDASDGQSDLKDAAEDVTADRDYNFKIEWGPTLTDTGASSPVSVFKAKAMSFVDNVGTVSDMIRGSCNLRIKTGTIGFTAGVSV